MKKVFLLVSLKFFALLVWGQTEDVPDSFYVKKADSTYNAIKKVRLDMAVPDAPAFKALGNDPSEILRPSDPKQFALLIPNFISGSNIVIPSSFAAEISPGLLASKYSLNDYYEKPMLRTWLKTRFSIGSGGNDTSGRKIAFGIRTTFFESHEFKADRAFINENIRNLFLKPIHVEVEKAWEEYIAIDPAILEDQEKAKAKRAEIKKIVLNRMGKQFKNLPETIDSLREVYKKKYWNASRLDFAYAFVAQSKDSLLKGILADKHMFWLAGSIRPGCNWAQIVFSAASKIFSVDGNSKTEWVMNGRTYVGSNKVKGFAEVQYQKSYPNIKTIEKSLFFNAGLEVGIIDGVWLHMGTGVMNFLDKSTRKNELTGNLNIYITFPENFKLF